MHGLCVGFGRPPAGSQHKVSSHRQHRRHAPLGPLTNARLPAHPGWSLTTAAPRSAAQQAAAFCTELYLSQLSAGCRTAYLHILADDGWGQEAPQVEAIALIVLEGEPLVVLGVPQQVHARDDSAEARNQVGPHAAAEQQVASLSLLNPIWDNAAAPCWHRAARECSTWY